ncbi:RIP metalloprotease RseP [Campylobacter sp. RM9344]|uniref:Zinc metalloprotease n=1 Tax=Campylobacter californiensis TaxID=1032243 RepID=A0AAW3ZVL7_9BACT|nr:MULTISPECIES: RIP metalloprotease RseP [unclassified Campylobacter]MBE2984363.1 RIP metalloprotease RseP [Campylobacter sp. RM6883]MBE2994770.1 RIP metalloprotease RseP [Campylobacter sp. RM6913]MBE3030155.1 RIP metalloprotease RseP [Campylobacter sp. RM9344]MBE3608724.1 RIP metalloprotease RseP [Campylobacter sp. RM9337]QCD50704.1 RseP-like zinc metalloprotease [Campylobacter sp. RM6914]
MKGLIFTLVLLLLGLWAYSFYFLVTVFAISFLIFFHELGHFLAARSVGIAVNTFSIGFGNKIFTKRVGNTDYCLSAIPLGGYVQLKGQDDTDPAHKNYDADSYNTLTPLKRIYILFAGPFFNFILAFFIYIIIGFMGVDKLAPVVGHIAVNSAAYEAKLAINDKILAIDSNEIKEWDDISKNVKIQKTRLLIEREGQVLEIYLTPKIGSTQNAFNERIQKPLIGISPKGKIVKIYHSGLSAVKFGIDETINASKLIFLGFQKLVSGIVPLKEVGGIVQITDITSKAAQINISVLLLIVALISVNLGVLNLLPIPALDGGHILFNLYELLFRREVNERVYVALTYCGWAVLLSLMLLATYNDIMRLSGGYQ